MHHLRLLLFGTWYFLRVVRTISQDLTLCFSVNRHFYPNAEERFPALSELPHLQPLRALLLSGIICKSQSDLKSGDYTKLILINRYDLAIIILEGKPNNLLPSALHPPNILSM